MHRGRHAESARRAGQIVETAHAYRGTVRRDTTAANRWGSLLPRPLRLHPRACLERPSVLKALNDRGQTTGGAPQKLTHVHERMNATMAASVASLGTGAAPGPRALRDAEQIELSRVPRHQRGSGHAAHDRLRPMFTTAHRRVGADSGGTDLDLRAWVNGEPLGLSHIVGWLPVAASEGRAHVEL